MNDIITPDYKDESEAKLTDRAILKYPHTFKHDSGMGYQGKLVRMKSAGALQFEQGETILRNPTKFKYGLGVGFGDTIGWTEVLVTPELMERLMGKTIAIYTSIEIKTKNDKPDRDQIINYFNTRLSGGIAKFIHCDVELSVDEILAMSRRTDPAAEVKDEIINKLHAEYKRRRGTV
jgi:hypothetical protein